MTKAEWNKLKEGDKVWVFPSYFTFEMLGVVKVIKHKKGVWVNFFGDGQTHLCPTERNKLWHHVEKYEETKDDR